MHVDQVGPINALNMGKNLSDNGSQRHQTCVRCRTTFRSIRISTFNGGNDRSIFGSGIGLIDGKLNLDWRKYLLEWDMNHFWAGYVQREFTMFTVIVVFQRFASARLDEKPKVIKDVQLGRADGSNSKSIL